MTHHYAVDAMPIGVEHTTVQAAALELKQRRERARHLPEAYFGEPAWDILLDLFVADAGGRDIPVGSACVAGGVPPTTGLRWVNALVSDGLVERFEDLEDRRRILVRITQRGKSIVDQILADRGAVSIECFDGLQS